MRKQSHDWGVDETSKKIWASRLGLSPKLKLPVVYVGEAGNDTAGVSDLPIWTYLAFLWRLRGWKIEDRGEVVECYHLRDHLFLTRSHAFISIYEWGQWEKCYLPKGGVKGLNVLDVGAGCGETAHFFFSRGAKKVIAMEPDETRSALLRKNVSLNGWNAEVLAERFSLEHLERLDIDFVKMDIEGGEEALLSLDRLPRIGMEVHGEGLKNRFVQKFGIKVIEGNRGRGLFMLSNAT